MIIMDRPRTCHFRGWGHRTAHLMSTLPGDAGTAELLAFGARIGMREDWLQHRGQEREHFDLFNGRCDAAIKAGAEVVPPRRLVEVIREKRSALRLEAPDAP